LAIVALFRGELAEKLVKIPTEEPAEDLLLNINRSLRNYDRA